ncbi:MAG: short-chain dehydrogenase/reductase [Verrucomicrobiaceae bacterium]|nr:short-chain dehydrogenase/reductase [Verrucomicrobiaceae bacterium]
MSSVNPENDIASGSATRRHFVGTLASGVAAGFAVSAQAEEKTVSGLAAPPAQTVVQNPVTEYPQPPFPKQLQEWPGLAGKMTPRPDHGEKTYQGTGRLTGRKALITGGDSGIGRAAAIAFAREGADVAINYLPAEEEDAKEVLALIREAGRKAIAIPGDIREEEFCKKLTADAVQGLGGLDILVNNAGRQQSVDSILDLTTEAFDATFKTNFYAIFWITKAAIPHMKPGASIINTGSEQAYDPSASLLDYASTKAAIINFTKSLSKQLGPKGIRVNAVAPGPVWTPLQISGGQPQEKLPEFGKKTSLGRAGQPVELAPLYVLLASQESSFVTGQVHGASGGGGSP